MTERKYKMTEREYKMTEREYVMIEKNLRRLGLLGIISLLSYTAMVVFSPLAYPGYDWLSMAVSDLSADGAPSQALAGQLNSLFGPCGIVSIMAVVVGSSVCKSKLLKVGIYFFAAMEWVCNVGYSMFPWVAGAETSHPQNIMHLVVTVLVVVFSLAALILIAVGSGREGKIGGRESMISGREGMISGREGMISGRESMIGGREGMISGREGKISVRKGIKGLRVWAIVCLAAMLLGPIGTGLMPKAVFGLFERFSTFSAVVFNAVLGWYLYTGRFEN